MENILTPKQQKFAADSNETIQDLLNALAEIENKADIIEGQLNMFSVAINGLKLLVKRIDECGFLPSPSIETIKLGLNELCVNTFDEERTDAVPYLSYKASEISKLAGDIRAVINENLSTYAVDLAESEAKD